MLPIGIWQDIRLEGRSVAKLDDVHLRQNHQDGSVVLEAMVSLERWQDDPLVAVMHVSGPDGSTVQTEAQILEDYQTRNNFV